MNVLCRAGGRVHWGLILLLCIALEGGALYYQHVLHYYPCELCIYVRVWVLALALVALFAVVVAKPIWRLLATLVALGLSIGLGFETWNLVKVEYALGNGGSCGFKANFPAWAPLDEWLPAMFEVQDMCQATPPLLAGISMTHALILTSALLILSLLAALIVQLRKR